MDLNHPSRLRMHRLHQNSHINPKRAHGGRLGGVHRKMGLQMQKLPPTNSLILRRGDRISARAGHSSTSEKAETVRNTIGRRRSKSRTKRSAVGTRSRNTISGKSSSERKREIKKDAKAAVNDMHHRETRHQSSLLQGHSRADHRNLRDPRLERHTSNSSDSDPQQSQQLKISRNLIGRWRCSGIQIVLTIVNVQLRLPRCFKRPRKLTIISWKSTSACRICFFVQLLS
mmetsp:Transcript_125063/g.198065  ORF Transcript_125063/g.198065 Transcript_125063/m.198065 type:complete len:229 (+) Transcript_125063:2257-2943(+)